MLEYITQAEFSKIEKHFQVNTGRPRHHDLFKVFNAILHILITGSQWRSLPKDYPNYKTVFYYFRIEMLLTRDVQNRVRGSVFFIFP